MLVQTLSCLQPGPFQVLLPHRDLEAAALQTLIALLGLLMDEKCGLHFFFCCCCCFFSVSLFLKVGFKPAGGIRTAKEAITWLMLVKEELGVEWLTPELFRLGASSLLGDIEQQVSCWQLPAPAEQK